MTRTKKILENVRKCRLAKKQQKKILEQQKKILQVKKLKQHRLTWIYNNVSERLNKQELIKQEGVINF